MTLERHAGRLWVASAGGPLLVLESRRLRDWGGLETGDYDRACATTSVVDAIEVGDGLGMLLGDEPAMTAVVERADGLAFVRWHAADDVDAVERAIVAMQRSPTMQGTPTGLSFEWTDDALVVFDSVEAGSEQTQFSLPPGREIGDGGVRVAITPGTWAVRLGALDPSVGSLSIVQLLRA